MPVPHLSTLPFHIYLSFTPTYPSTLLIPTGEEMNFTELLKSFGLDMASVASALGIDIHTLNSMGNDELLLILTQ